MIKKTIRTQDKHYINDVSGTPRDPPRNNYSLLLTSRNEAQKPNHNDDNTVIPCRQKHGDDIKKVPLLQGTQALLCSVHPNWPDYYNGVHVRYFSATPPLSARSRWKCIKGMKNEGYNTIQI